MKKIAVVGLGYVGLPLALSLSKKFDVVGYDSSIARIKQLKYGFDLNREYTKKEILSYKKIRYSKTSKDIKDCNVFFVTIPTPIDLKNQPDLRLLKSATNEVGKYLKKGDIVVYESTVFPGTTEEICVPILSKKSGLKYNKDFFCSYSPERINPGDKVNTLRNIVKIVSGSNKKTIKEVKKIYQNVLKKKIYVCKSIKVAEAAKIIENVQRDLNISLINEFTMICNKMGLSVYDVLDAAKTKWNFLNFKPGLVGGHCIGVDPYYLTYKAKKIGVNPRVVLSGRHTNDIMPYYYGKLFIDKLKKKKINIFKSKILMLGGTFKENISDTRNSKALELARFLEKRGCNVKFFDPHINTTDFRFKNKLIKNLKNRKFDGIILAVAHKIFKKYGIKKISKFKKNNGILFDLKNLFENHKLVDIRV